VCGSRPGQHGYAWHLGATGAAELVNQACPGSLSWPCERPASARWGSAQASCRPARGADRQPDGTRCLEGHHAAGPKRVHLLGRGCQTGDDPRTPYPPDSGGAGGRSASALLLARVQAPRAHRQIATSASAGLSVPSCASDERQVRSGNGAAIGVRRRSPRRFVPAALTLRDSCALQPHGRHWPELGGCALSPQGRFQLVDVSQWDSAGSTAAEHAGPGSRASRAGMVELAPGGVANQHLYQVVAATPSRQRPMSRFGSDRALPDDVKSSRATRSRLATKSCPSALCSASSGTSGVSWNKAEQRDRYAHRGYQVRQRYMHAESAITTVVVWCSCSLSVIAAQSRRCAYSLPLCAADAGLSLLSAIMPDGWSAAVARRFRTSWRW